jgi:hypothetical protein
MFFSVDGETFDSSMQLFDPFHCSLLINRNQHLRVAVVLVRTSAVVMVDVPILFRSAQGDGDIWENNPSEIRSYDRLLKKR